MSNLPTPSTPSEALPAVGKNCWTCKHDEPPRHYCRILHDAPDAGLDTVEAVRQWIAAVIGDGMMPSRDTDGCPGYAPRSDADKATPPVIDVTGTTSTCSYSRCTHGTTARATPPASAEDDEPLLSFVVTVTRTTGWPGLPFLASAYPEYCGLGFGARRGATEADAVGRLFRDIAPIEEREEATPDATGEGVHPLYVAMGDAVEAYKRAEAARVAAFNTTEDTPETDAAIIAAEEVEDAAFMARNAAEEAWSAAGFPRATGGGS